MFELYQTEASEAEGDGLEDTQKAGDTNGETPHEPVQVDN